MTPPLFARYLRDTISISFKMRKKEREKLFFIKHLQKMSGFRETPHPPNIKLWNLLTKITKTRLKSIETDKT